MKSALASCVMTGCFYVKPAVTEPPETFDCDDQTCTVTVSIDSADLMACYDPGTGLPVFPPELTDCDPMDVAAGNDCEFNLYNESVPVERCCALPSDVDDGTADCCAEMDIQEVEDATTTLEDFDVFATGECGGLAYAVPIMECDHVPGLEDPVETGEECTELSMVAYGADFDLTVDPALSFVDIDSETIGTATSTLTGSGGAAVGPSRFLRAYMTGTSVTLSAGYLQDVEIILWDEALVWTNNDNYWVPSGQINGLTVQGTLGGSPVAWDVLGDGSPANGVLDPERGTWHLDYLVSDADGTFEVHLEGPAFAL